MSATITYKGETLTTATNQTRVLETEGTYLEDDITITDVTGAAPSGTKNISITANGTTTEDVTSYATASITTAVPASAVDSGTKSISISSNGTTTHDVVGYASASITANVPNSYSASDEGKVVSSGALVSQTAHADVTPTTSDQTINTTTNNSIKVKGDADLVAGNIKKDVEIFGVTGSYEGGGGGDTLEWKASRTSFPSFGGIYGGKNLTLDFDNKVGSLPAINYMGMSNGADGKLTLKNLSSSLTSSNMNLGDFLRQAPAFKEIDLGGAAPASMTRWLYQWNYSANSKFATTPITITNLSLDNLSSQNTSFNSGGTYAQSVDIYFLGYLKNTINLSAWVMLNADSWNRLVERLYDYSGGDTHTLTVGSTILALIDSAHQAIATARGWTLA